MADAPRNFEDLGPNEWLVDEMYEQFRADPASVSESWQEFFADYRKAYGEEPGPDAIFGYEAMAATLQSIKNAGAKGNDRSAVVDEFFKLSDRESVLGTYSIDRRGDTTLNQYGGMRVENGTLVFDRVIAPSS